MKNSEEKRKMLLLRFCDYYAEKCPDTCFVAEENGTVVGYVICCPDSAVFKKEFPKFAKRNGSLSIFQRLQCFGDSVLYLPFKAKYPAHLHIDILPDAQRKGYGKKLIEALTEELRKQGKCGVMLAVSAGNTNALKFYKALDFKTIFHLPRTYFLGKKL